MARKLTAEEHPRVTEAIPPGEGGTSGEFYCVVPRRGHSFFFPAISLVLAFILAGSLVVALVLEHWWVSVRLPWFAAAQVLAALCAGVVLWIVPALRIHLVPHQLRHRRAHDNALKQFLARNVHLTAQRTGVLLFVSLAEHYAEVVADSGIDRKVEPETWEAAVAMLISGARDDRLADGFVDAVGAVGSVLAAHFPIGSGDQNELDDHLVEI